MAGRPSNSAKRATASPANLHHHLSRLSGAKAHPSGMAGGGSAGLCSDEEALYDSEEEEDDEDEEGSEEEEEQEDPQAAFHRMLLEGMRM